MHMHASSSTPVAVATAIDANVTANMWRSTTTTTAVTELHVTKLDGSSATYVVGTTGVKWAGVGSGDVIPQAAFLLSCRTGLRGPQNRGRFYLPYVNEAGQSNGTLIAGDVTAGQTAWNTFLTAMQTASVFPTVASYAHAVQTHITSFVYEAKMATQRNRMSRLR